MKSSNLNDHRLTRIDAPLEIREVFVHVRYGEFWVQSPKAHVKQRLISHLLALGSLAQSIHTSSQNSPNTITRLSTNEFGFYTSRKPINVEDFKEIITALYHQAKNLDGNVHLLLTSFGVLWPNHTLHNSALYIQGGLGTPLGTPIVRYFAKENFSSLDKQYAYPNSYSFYPLHSDHQDPKYSPQILFQSLIEKNILTICEQYRSCFIISSKSRTAKAFLTIEICRDHLLKVGEQNLVQLIKNLKSKTHPSLLPIYVDHFISSAEIKNFEKHAQSVLSHISTNSNVEKVGRLNKIPFSCQQRQSILRAIPKVHQVEKVKFTNENRELKLYRLHFGQPLRVHLYPPKAIGLLPSSLFKSILKHTQIIHPHIVNASLRRINFFHGSKGSQIHIELNAPIPRFNRIKALLTCRADITVINSDGLSVMDVIFQKKVAFINRFLETAQCHYDFSKHLNGHNTLFECAFLRCSVEKLSQISIFNLYTPSLTEWNTCLKIALIQNNLEKLKYIFSFYTSKIPDNNILCLIKKTFNYRALQLLLKLSTHAHSLHQLKRTMLLSQWSSLPLTIEILLIEASHLFKLSELFFLIDPSFHPEGDELFSKFSRLTLNPQNKTLSKQSIATLIQLKHYFKLNFNQNKLLEIVVQDYSYQSLVRVLRAYSLGPFSKDTLLRLMNIAILNQDYTQFDILLSYFKSPFINPSRQFPLENFEINNQWCRALIDAQLWSLLYSLTVLNPDWLCNTQIGFPFLISQPSFPTFTWLQSFPKQAKASNLLAYICQKPLLDIKLLMECLKFDSLFRRFRGTYIIEFLFKPSHCRKLLNAHLNTINTHLLKFNHPPIAISLLRKCQFELYEKLLGIAFELGQVKFTDIQFLIKRWIVIGNPKKLEGLLKINATWALNMPQALKKEYGNWVFFAIQQQKPTCVQILITYCPKLLNECVQGIQVRDWMHLSDSRPPLRNTPS